MASGFIILKDGRCFAKRWSVYDFVVECAIKELPQDENAREFKDWLKSLVPNEHDEEMGFAFIRAATGEHIDRHLDLRELTPENQNLFWPALQRSLQKLLTTPQVEDHEYEILWLRTLLKMKRLADKRDNPDNLSDWQKGYTEPPSGNKVGPGW